MQGFFVYQLCIRRDKPKNRFHAMMRSMNTTKHTGFLLEVTTFPHLLPCNFYLQFMYRSNGSFNMPPPGNPRAFDFFENYCSNSPYPGQNAVQMPHTRVHSGDQMPPPRGHFTGTKMTERRWKRLQLSNKIFINITKTEKHC